MQKINFNNTPFTIVPLGISYTNKQLRITVEKNNFSLTEFVKNIELTNFNQIYMLSANDQVLNTYTGYTKINSIINDENTYTVMLYKPELTTGEIMAELQSVLNVEDDYYDA